MVKSWLPCEQEEFSAVDASGHQSSWCNAAGIQHWKMILSTLTMDKDGSSNANTKLCYGASSQVHLIPAFPPPTRTQRAYKYNDSALVLEPEVLKQSTKAALQNAVRTPVITVMYFVVLYCTYVCMILYYAKQISDL